MHSVLLVIEKPAVLNQAKQLDWQSLRQQAKDIAQQYQGVQILGENTFLLDLTHGLTPLSRFLALADTKGLEHRALFFQEEPKWVCSSS